MSMPPPFKNEAPVSEKQPRPLPPTLKHPPMLPPCFDFSPPSHLIKFWGAPPPMFATPVLWETLSYFLTHWQQRECRGKTLYITFCVLWVLLPSRGKFVFYCTMHWCDPSTVLSSFLKHISKKLLMMKTNC